MGVPRSRGWDAWSVSALTQFGEKFGHTQAQARLGSEQTTGNLQRQRQSLDLAL